MGYVNEEEVRRAGTRRHYLSVYGRRDADSGETMTRSDCVRERVGARVSKWVITYR
jgi:hypothetical protein